MGRSVKAIIVDDESKARFVLKSMLEILNANVEVVAEAASVSNAIAIYNKIKPDVMFLDVEIKEGNAFDILSQLKEISAKIIFITAYDKYAVQAFQYAAVDYLLKPIDVNDLKRALSRLEQKEEPSLGENGLHTLLENLHNSVNDQKIAIHGKETIEVVGKKDVLYFESDGNYTWVHTTNKKILSTRILKEYQQLLEESRFYRIHHKFMINLDQLEKYVRGEGGRVIMSNGAELEVSRRKKPEFLDLLKSEL